MKLVCPMIILILFVSCRESKNDRVARLFLDCAGKEIHFPDNIAFSSLGMDTVSLLSLDYDYAIVSYSDSVGCINCKLQLDVWNDFLKKKDFIIKNKVILLFILHPLNRREMIDLLERHNFTYPVCIDMDDEFRKLNNLIADESLQTFLLDKKNKVVAIGNPIQNPKVKELYLQIIMGDKTPKETARMQTTVACPMATLDMGKFDWQQEQTGSFELTNTGNHPLVVIDAVTSCGCTSVAYDKAPIPPGKSTELKVRYKADHPEHFNKTITVHCNAETSPVKLSIKGNAR